MSIRICEPNSPDPGVGLPFAGLRVLDVSQGLAGPYCGMLLGQYGALPESRAAIHQYIQAARAALDEVPASASRAALTGLTEFLAQQTDALGVPA